MAPRIPRIPRIPLPGLPKPLSRVRATALARTRRAGVKLLTSAVDVPVVRPFAELGLRTFFDAIAGDWERIRKDPTYRAGFEEALHLLPRGFRPRRALDAACGTGLATSIVLGRWPGLNVVGTDIAPRMVEIARELVPDARFEVASVHHLPFEDGEFDLVTLLDGVLDIPELLRVLHRKGRLLIVYSVGGTTPVSRPVTKLAAEFAQHGAIAEPHTDGEAHALVVRHGR
ncbi:MAG: Methyltransferase type 11 [Thermoleophilia bacterium]|nr:Methyltransferase type 11 [Thermoleophilia bacterium]MCZ4497353.1 Methyltransferase type 11 [Thermoleophilia bacterium]